MAKSEKKPYAQPVGKVWVFKLGEATFTTDHPPGVFGAVEGKVGDLVLSGLYMVVPWAATLTAAGQPVVSKPKISKLEEQNPFSSEATKPSAEKVKPLPWDKPSTIDWSKIKIDNTAPSAWTNSHWYVPYDYVSSKPKPKYYLDEELTKLSKTLADASKEEKLKAAKEYLNKDKVQAQVSKLMEEITGNDGNDDIMKF